MSKVRSSNLELYRIIVMLLIVAHHYVVNSGLMSMIAEEPLSGRSIFFYLFGAWGKTGINCFLLITGYFMCTSQITVSKFLKLLFEVIFYKIIYVIFLVSGYETFSLSVCIKSVVPMLNLTDVFVHCFLVFYLCIPFLNILVHNMDRRMHGLLVLLCLFIYTVHGTIPGMSVCMNYVSWFCVLYFIASYIRLYPTKMLSNVKWGGGYTLLCILVSSLSIVLALWINAKMGMHISQYRLVSDSNALMAVATAVCSFMYFKDLKIPYNKFINILGASTFGVLLIHANSDAMRRWLWKDVVDCLGHYTDDLFWLYPVVAVIIIFVICVTIDINRIYFLERPLFRFFEKRKI